ncbi:MAG: hypothetical protein M0Z49_16940 [Chloroflexi bacterium]|nr:hypothetical protein [Chloroflexota bacterium]
MTSRTTGFQGRVSGPEAGADAWLVDGRDGMGFAPDVVDGLVHDVRTELERAVERVRRDAEQA